MKHYNRYLRNEKKTHTHRNYCEHLYISKLDHPDELSTFLKIYNRQKLNQEIEIPNRPRTSQELELDGNQKLCPCRKAGDQMASKLNSNIQRRTDNNLLELFQQNRRIKSQPMLWGQHHSKQNHQKYYKTT